MDETCPVCNGSGEEWVDWADTTAPCHFCDGKRVVAAKEVRKLTIARQKQRRKDLKNDPISNDDGSPAEPPERKFYRLQIASVTFSDWDIPCDLTWKTTETFASLQYGLHKLRAVLKDWDTHGPDHGYNPRLLTPDGREVNSDGTIGRKATGNQHFTQPDERYSDYCDRHAERHDNW